MENKAVFDFDKTLVTLNTFPIWIVFVIIYSIIKLDFKTDFLKLLWKRKIAKTISHNQFKCELLKVDLNQNYHDTFAKLISNFKNEKCIKELNKLQNQQYKIAISSAAPEHYLKTTIQLLFPEHQFLVIGANIDSDKFCGNYKIEKVQNLIKMRFIESSEEIDCLYTDSFDDYPLAQFSKKLILVSPDKYSYLKYKESYKKEIVVI